MLGILGGKMNFSLKPKDRKYKDSEVNFEILPIEKSKKDETIIEEKFNPYDYVRVVNIRGEPEYQAKSDEKVIVAHRGNPILGNKHPMKAQTMKERERVISEYKKDLKADLETEGQMYKSLKEIAKDIIENNQKIALQCFCHPCACHAQELVPVIINMVEDLLLLNKENKFKFKI